MTIPVRFVWVASTSYLVTVGTDTGATAQLIINSPPVSSTTCSSGKFLVQIAPALTCSGVTTYPNQPILFHQDVDQSLSNTKITIVQNTFATFTSGTSTNQGWTLPISSNDVLVVCEGQSGTGTQPGAPTDTLGSSYVSVASATQGTAPAEVMQCWTANSGAGGADTVTTGTYGATCTVTNLCTLFLTEVTGANLVTPTTTGTSAAAPTSLTMNSVSFTSTPLAVGFYQKGTSGVAVPGTSFQLLNGEAGSSLLYVTEQSSQLSASTTTFPATAGTGTNFAGVGLVFVTTPRVVQNTFATFTTGTSGSKAFASNLAAQDVAVVCEGQSATSVQPTAPTDTLSLSYKSITSATQATSTAEVVQCWGASSNTGGADTITSGTYGATCSASALCTLFITEVSGADWVMPATTGTSAAAPTSYTMTSITLNNNPLLLGFYQKGTSGTDTAGTNFRLFNGESGSLLYLTEQSSALTTSTTFPATVGTGSNYAGVGLVFNYGPILLQNTINTASSGTTITKAFTNNLQAKTTVVVCEGQDLTGTLPGAPTDSLVLTYTSIASAAQGLNEVIQCWEAMSGAGGADTVTSGAYQTCSATALCTLFIQEVGGADAVLVTSTTSTGLGGGALTSFTMNSASVTNTPLIMGFYMKVTAGTDTAGTNFVLANGETGSLLYLTEKSSAITSAATTIPATVGTSSKWAGVAVIFVKATTAFSVSLSANTNYYFDASFSLGASTGASQIVYLHQMDGGVILQTACMVGSTTVGNNVCSTATDANLITTGVTTAYSFEIFGTIKVGSTPTTLLIEFGSTTSATNNVQVFKAGSFIIVYPTP